MKEAAELVIGILSGLKHLHSLPEPIIHGDLKPSNILLQGDSPRLTDFGIARLIKTDQSPTVQTDLWAAGVIFYELITGKLPNHETEFPADMPEGVAKIIAKALERDRDSRYSSAEEMQRELRLLFGSEEEQEEEPAYVSHPPTSKSSSLEWKLLAGFVILVAVLVGGYLAVFKNRAPDPAPVVTASGLKYIDLKEGDGPTPRLGQRVQVHYIGWLANGTEFNNSYKLGRPAEFPLGPALIPGWNEGLQSMKVGGKRRLIIPPGLAYGQMGRPPVIPPNETLTFEIELLAVKQN